MYVSCLTGKLVGVQALARNAALGSTDWLPCVIKEVHASSHTVRVQLEDGTLDWRFAQNVHLLPQLSESEAFQNQCVSAYHLDALAPHFSK